MQTAIESYLSQASKDESKGPKKARQERNRRKREAPDEPAPSSSEEHAQVDTVPAGVPDAATELDVPSGMSAETPPLRNAARADELSEPSGDVLWLQLRIDRIKKESEKTALLVFENDEFDLAGDTGTIGCVQWSHNADSGAVRLCLDLKGVVYETRTFSLCGSALAVDPTSQRVEAVLHDITYSIPTNVADERAQLIRGKIEPYTGAGSIAADNADTTWTVTAAPDDSSTASNAGTSGHRKEPPADSKTGESAVSSGGHAASH